jgi:CPA2 family monovalent cation:H+ antiporter-2
MEGGLEMLRLTLLALGYSAGQIQQYIDTVRTDTYEGILPGQRGYPALDQLLMATRGVEIAWQPLDADSPLVGRTLGEAGIRSQPARQSWPCCAAGGDHQPGPELRFMAGDSG